MFFRSKKAVAAVRVAVESLEGRSLMSATLSASAVEGKYKGHLTESDGSQLPIREYITSKVAELIIGGTTFKQTMSKSRLKALEDGRQVFNFTLSGAEVDFRGHVSAGGKRAAGKYSTSAGKDGTYSLVKYA